MFESYHVTILEGGYGVLHIAKWQSRSTAGPHGRNNMKKKLKRVISEHRQQLQSTWSWYTKVILREVFKISIISKKKKYFNCIFFHFKVQKRRRQNENIFFFLVAHNQSQFCLYGSCLHACEMRYFIGNTTQHHSIPAGLSTKLLKSNSQYEAIVKSTAKGL